MARGRKKKTTSSSFKRGNGKGCIYKLSGNRRRPYAVMITTKIEFNPDTMRAKQIQRYLGYYATEDEAQEALNDYMFNPYDIDSRNITFGEIYERWSAYKFKKISNSTISSYHMAYNYCTPLLDVPIINIKSQQLKDIVDACDHGSSTKKMIKALMCGVFDYAVENDIVAKNYASFIDIEAS